MLLDVCLLLSVTCSNPPLPERKPVTVMQIEEYLEEYKPDKPNPGPIRLTIEDLK